MVRAKTAGKIVPLSFYRRDDVVAIARELLGKYLFTQVDGEITGGIITETEAYAGPIDRASHAFNNRRTTRTEVIFQEGGVAYVYLCYGKHCLFNVVTNASGIPHAVLIRAIFPTHGLETMRKRRKGKLPLTDGPGNVCQALNITRIHNMSSLQGPPIWIEKGISISPDDIEASPRIGVDYAGEDALLPWRFNLCIDKYSSILKNHKRFFKK